jgi:hypothetical protein
VAAVSQGPLAAVSQGPLAAFSQGPLPAVSQGPLPAVSHSPLAAVSQGPFPVAVNVPCKDNQELHGAQDSSPRLVLEEHSVYYNVY